MPAVGLACLARWCGRYRIGTPHRGVLRPVLLRCCGVVIFFPAVCALNEVGVGLRFKICGVYGVVAGVQESRAVTHHVKICCCLL